MFVVHISSVACNFQNSWSNHEFPYCRTNKGHLILSLGNGALGWFTELKRWRTSIAKLQQGCAPIPSRHPQAWLSCYLRKDKTAVSTHISLGNRPKIRMPSRTSDTIWQSPTHDRNCRFFFFVHHFDCDPYFCRLKKSWEDAQSEYWITLTFNCIFYILSISTFSFSHGLNLETQILRCF